MVNTDTWDVLGQLGHFMAILHTSNSAASNSINGWKTLAELCLQMGGIENSMEYSCIRKIPMELEYSSVLHIEHSHELLMHKCSLNL